MKILLSGGGTAGHITPNLALLPRLRQLYTEIHYIGGKNGMEKRMLESEPDVVYHEITTTKLVRRSVIKNLLMPFRLIRGIIQSKKILRQTNPDIIFCKGGYVSVPVARAAKMLDIPVVCHESDLTLGLANKLIARTAKTLCTSFEETAKLTKNGVWCGSPIRKELLLARSEPLQRRYNLNPRTPTIAVVGGSLGAKIINDNISEILPSLCEKYQVLHLTGKGKQLDYKHPRYHQEEYTDSIGEVFAASDMVVSRSGSNTIFELAVLGKPMLLVPLKKGNSRGDQVDNANYFHSLGIANVLLEEDLTPERLLEEIEKTIKSAQTLRENIKKANLQNGTENIVRELQRATIKRK